MTERFQGEPERERRSEKASGAGTPSRKDVEQPDVDAFLRQPRNSLTDEYWRPVDSLIPVRLVDMRDDAEASPSSKRRIRALDVGIAAVGIVALLLLVGVMLHKGDASSKARGADSKAKVPTVLDRASATRPTEIVAVKATRPAPLSNTPKAALPEPTSNTTQALASSASTPPASSVDETRASTATAPPAASASAAADPASGAHRHAKRHHKKTVEPPTASFPDP